MMWGNSHSLCVSFSLGAYGFKMTLDYSFQQNSGLYPGDMLSGLAGMLQFCRQDKNCMDTAKRITNSLKSMLQAALANPDVFQWQLTSLSPLKHTPKNGCTFGKCVKLLPSPFLADRKVVSRFVALVIQVAGQQVHQRATAGLSSTAQPTLQFGLLSKGPGVGVLTHTHSWRPWLGQCTVGCWSCTHRTGREQIPGTGGMRLTAAEQVLLVKWSWKVSWKKTLNRGRKLSPWSCSATFDCYSLLP